MQHASTAITTTGKQSSHRFEILDGLRGMAAGTVLFSHACSQIGTLKIFHDKITMAVYFFFMLSGFVVACAYQERLKSGMSVSEFYIRRAIRLYPLIIVGSLVCIAYLVALEPGFMKDPTRHMAVATSFLGLPFPYAGFTRHAFPINPPEWSLFYEILAYLIYGVVAARLRTWHLVLVSLVSLSLFSFWSHYYDGQRITLTAQVFSALAPFTIGILLWRIYETGVVRIAPLPFWALSLLVVGPCALPAFDKGFDALIVAAIFPYVILSGAAHGSDNSGPVTRMLGDLSYPVYILHWPFVAAAPYLFPDPWRRMALAIGACVTAIGFAWVVYRFYDMPVRQWMTKRLLGKRTDNRKAAATGGGTIPAGSSYDTEFLQPGVARAPDTRDLL